MEVAVKSRHAVRQVFSNAVTVYALKIEAKHFLTLGKDLRLQIRKCLLTDLWH
jgi:hypothetical protein